MDSWFPSFGRLVLREIPLPALRPGRASAAQRHALLRLIAAGLELNLPLAPLLEQWAQDERGTQRARVKKLAGLLATGRPLAEAVEEVPGVLHEQDVLAIRFDAQMGTRTAAVRQILDDSAAGAFAAAERVRGDLIYVGIVIFIAMIVITFVQIKIVPVFQKMFQEFGLRLPEVLRAFIDVSRALAQYWWIGGLAVIVLVWCFFSTRAGQFVRNSLFTRLLHALRELQDADVLRKLSLATSAGRPIAGALSTLARYHFVPAVRHQLLFVRNEIEQGAEVWHSLEAVGLLQSTELRLLQTAERVGNRAWVLEQLAAVKEARARQRLERAAQFVLPVLTLLLGGMVLFHCLALMVPLIQLIQGHL